MSDPKGFLKFQRQEIPRRPIAHRLQDWKEVDLSPHPELMQTQSVRCMDCGVPFCQSDTGCPVNNLIPEWNSLVSQNRWQEAATRLLATNNFPEFTGRLCPAPCESACVLGVNADPVNIKSLEWGIIDKAFAMGWVQAQKPSYQTGRQVAIVGSGPAGLAAAQQLARSGHRVTVFEKAKFIGGLLRYGIPDFKLEKKSIDRRILQLQEEGVQFQTEIKFGQDFHFADIKENFDALILATGAEKPRDLNIPGRQLRGIHFAMDYLVEQNQFLNGEIPAARINAREKRVIILGGGDTGSDCLGTALRQGAKQVLQFEIQAQPPPQRDASTPWPLWPMKLKSSHAHEEGGQREWSLSTLEFLGQNKNLQQLRALRLDDKTEHFFAADLVILALGFTGPHRDLAVSLPDLKFTPQGNFLTSKNLMTSIPGVFAGGDNRRGASLIVWAIAEGRRLAQSVNHYLESQSLRK